MSLYHELAEHITEGRADDLDTDSLERWLAWSDRHGGHTAWMAFDEAVDVLVAAYRESAETDAGKETTQ